MTLASACPSASPGELPSPVEDFGPIRPGHPGGSWSIEPASDATLSVAERCLERRGYSASPGLSPRSMT